MAGLQLERLELSGELLTCVETDKDGKCLTYLQTCDGEDCLTESPEHPAVPGRKTTKKRKRKTTAKRTTAPKKARKDITVAEADEDAFSKGIAAVNKKLGSDAREYDRVLGGMSSVLERKGVNVSTDQLAVYFHDPLALAHLQEHSNVASLKQMLEAVFEQDLARIEKNYDLPNLINYATSTRGGWELEKVSAGLRANEEEMLRETAKKIAADKVSQLTDKPRKGSKRYDETVELLLPRGRKEAKLKTYRYLENQIRDLERSIKHTHDPYFEKLDGQVAALDIQSQVIRALNPNNKLLEKAGSTRGYLHNAAFKGSRAFDSTLAEAKRQLKSFETEVDRAEREFKPPKNAEEWEKTDAPQILSARGLPLKKGQNEYLVNIQQLRSTDGFDYQVVAGKPVTIPKAEFLDLFLHKSLANPDSWTISEAKTGLAFVQATMGKTYTQAEVIQEATRIARDAFTDPEQAKTYKGKIDKARKIADYPHLGERVAVMKEDRRVRSIPMAGLALAGDLLTCSQWQIMGKPGEEYIRCKSYKLTCIPGDPDCVPRMTTDKSGKMLPGEMTKMHAWAERQVKKERAVDKARAKTIPEPLRLLAEEAQKSKDAGSFAKRIENKVFAESGIPRPAKDKARLQRIRSKEAYPDIGDLTASERELLKKYQVKSAFDFMHAQPLVYDHGYRSLEEFWNAATGASELQGVPNLGDPSLFSLAQSIYGLAKVLSA